MSRSHHRRPRGFTLVELLVVIGIIAILMALLTPAVMWAVNAARRTRMGVEIAALAEAVEKYKTAKGDYPPNFRDVQAFIRHLRRAYPKMAPNEFKSFFQVDAMNNLVLDAAGNPQWRTTSGFPLDEGESLVFWLAGTRNDPLYPFGLSGGANSAFQTYYEFDQRRLMSPDGDVWPSCHSAYAKDTYYLYMDSRSYDELLMRNAGNTAFVNTGAFAEGVTTNTVRPYVADTTAATYPPPTLAIINPTTFQIVTAGQDGEFGIDPATAAPTAWKGFPGGQNYEPADRDNITNFSEGRTLEDHIP